MPHFTNLHSLQWASWDQFHNFMRIVKGGSDSEAYQQWWSDRVAEYLTEQAAARLYPSDSEKSAEAAQEATGCSCSSSRMRSC